MFSSFPFSTLQGHDNEDEEVAAGEQVPRVRVRHQQGQPGHLQDRPQDSQGFQGTYEIVR